MLDRLPGGSTGSNGMPQQQRRVTEDPHAGLRRGALPPNLPKQNGEY